jgi:hypothetical protein
MCILRVIAKEGEKIPHGECVPTQLYLAWACSNLLVYDAQAMLSFCGEKDAPWSLAEAMAACVMVSKMGRREEVISFPRPLYVCNAFVSVWMAYRFGPGHQMALLDRSAVCFCLSHMLYLPVGTLRKVDVLYVLGKGYADMIVDFLLQGNMNLVDEDVVVAFVQFVLSLDTVCNDAAAVELLHQLQEKGTTSSPVLLESCRKCLGKFSASPAHACAELV